MLEKTLFYAKERKETEENPRPVTNVIRHGKSNYKEYFDNNYKFDPIAAEKNLTPEQLDITEVGIKELEESADQVIANIDKENEIVLLVTSPSARAYSSLLVVKSKLEQAGISILNSSPNQGDPNRIYITSQLRPLDLKDLDADLDPFMVETRAYLAEGENAKKPVDQMKQEIADRMKRSFGDLYKDESTEKLGKRLKRFLAHMNRNLFTQFSDETKAIIGKKKLRIICFTHEEVPVQFLRQVYGREDTPNLKNGQVIEISSERMDGKEMANVKLLPKGESTEIREKALELE